MNPLSNNQKEQALMYSLIEQEYRNHRQEALTDALALVQSGASEESIKSHIEGIRARYSSLLAKVKFNIHGSGKDAFEAYEQEEANKAIQKNGKTLNRLSDELKLYETERRKLQLNYDWSQYWWRITLEIIIFGGEISFNTLGFTSMGGSLILAALPATVFSIVLGLAAHFIPRFVQSRETQSGKTTAGALFGLFMVAIFFAIGVLRSTAAFGGGMLEGILNGNVRLGVGLFTLLNSFMFFGAMILAWKIPSKEDRMTKDAHDKLGKEIKRVRGEMEKLEKDNKNMLGTIKVSKSQQIQITSAETHFDDLIKNYCEETIRAFLTQIVFSRANHPTPANILSNHKPTNSVL